MNDLLDALEAVHRRVHAGTDGDAVAVVLERRYPAGPADVWDALTAPDRLARWFLPVTGDLRPGGRFRTEGNADGEILACDAPHRLVVTWGAPESIVSVRLTADGPDTRLELEHAVPAAYVPDAGGALYVGPGWDEALVTLGLYLAGDTIPPDLGTSPQMYEYGGHTVRAWESALRRSGMATDEQVDAAVAVSLQQFAVRPQDGDGA